MAAHNVTVRQIAANAYRVYRGGHLMIYETATPFRDSARQLLADGAKAHDFLTCEIEGHAVYRALTQRIGKLADTDS
jgi:hypothetical protein